MEVENKKDFKNPQELFDFLCQTMEYGWIGNDGNHYIQTMKGLRETYLTNTAESSLTSHLITCIEQIAIVEYYAKIWGYPVKKFCIRKYEDTPSFGMPIKMHCFSLYQKDGMWYHFEFTNPQIKGIHAYESIDACIKNMIEMYQNENRVLSEIPTKIPKGLSFFEWNQFLNQFPIYQIQEKEHQKQI